MATVKPIAFINLSHPDDARRRNVVTRIRRHVMGHLNRSRRGRPLTVKKRKDSPTDGGHNHHDSTSGISDSQGTYAKQILANLLGVLRPPWPGQSLNPLGCLPVEADLRTLELLHVGENHLLRRRMAAC
jgi:hypothetical protein